MNNLPQFFCDFQVDQVPEVTKFNPVFKILGKG
jgi:hypothetical protein